MRIPEDRWDDWLVRRERQRNAESGKPWFLSSAPVPDPGKHNPSRLDKCHRKTYYQVFNSPEEKAEPRGVFFLGRRVEEDLVLPFLDDVTDESKYVGNDLDVYFSVDHRGAELVFSGDTDPVLLDGQGQPEQVIEVKTAQSLPDEPRPHHLAQLHCYMMGMDNRYGQAGDEGVLIYVSRDGLDFRTFTVEWDEGLWMEILNWAVDQTRFREDGELPPADPVHDWECEYCPFRERCMQDLGPGEGLVDGVDYPERKLREWATALDSVVVPPRVAREHPGIVEDDNVEVRGWECVGCGGKIRWDDRRVDPGAEKPVCPECVDRDGSLHRLVLED